MNSYASRATLKSGNNSYTIYRLPALEAAGFKFENAAVKSTCGCGSSFSV